MDLLSFFVGACAGGAILSLARRAGNRAQRVSDRALRRSVSRMTSRERSAHEAALTEVMRELDDLKRDLAAEIEVNEALRAQIVGLVPPPEEEAKTARPSLRVVRDLDTGT